MNLPAWIAALAGAGIAAGAFARWIGRPLWRLFTGTQRFLVVFFGEPSRDGIPAILGVMARIAALEGAVKRIEDETKPNGGTSMRDVLHRAASDVATVKDQVAAQGVQLSAQGVQLSTQGTQLSAQAAQLESLQQGKDTPP